jgi:hypothetical protein
MNYRILRNHFDPKPIEAVLPAHGREVPRWLGDFKFSVFGPTGKARKSLPYRVREFMDELALLCPEQDFNTAFVQRYDVGTSVKPHRDPRNNVGYTVIAVLGEFEGATTRLHLEPEHVTFTLKSGDILVLPCTINGVQGCIHEVSPVLSGTRYAVILNTVLTGDHEKPLADEVFS